MAVSFNVPKSPKKDIFVIDEFQGVDLTNTETSVDDNKSPNAENMVRLVPGKVRKRTGYKTRVIFSDGTDVNRVINSSEKYVDIDVENMGDTPETGIIFAKFYDIIPSGDVSIHFDVLGKGHYRFVKYPNPPSTSWEFNFPVEKEWAFWGSNAAQNPEGIQDLRVYRIGDAQEGDFLKVKKVILCMKASSPSQYMEWRPAPEDNGGIYVKRTNIDPIYGCHILKTYDANRVVNVNRALDTKDTFESYTVSDSAETKLADIADPLYENSDTTVRVKVFVDMDYICDNPCIVYVGGWHYSTHNFLEDTSGSEQHYSMSINAGNFKPPFLSIKAISGTANVQVKNITVTYQKDSNYAWSPAPEDNGGIFHTEDIYDTLPNNYAINEEYYYSGDSSSLTATADIPIGNASSYVIGFAYIAFDLETSVSEELDRVIVRILNNGNSDKIVYEKEFTENVYQHFSLYLSSGWSNRYFEKIQVEFHLANTDAQCLAYAKNIEVKQIRLRSEYTIFAKNYLYHVGKELYLYTTASDKIESVYSNMNQSRSQSWQLNDKLILLDGKTVFLYEFGKTPVDLTSGIGYIPTVTIGKLPGSNPGGTSYESLNLIQPGFIEMFTVTEATKTEQTFKLSFSKLDYSPDVKVEVRTGSTWVKKTQNTDYYVYWTTGEIYFITGHLPGKSDNGEDNVRITAYRTVDGYADRIKKCTIGTLFGVGGASDRLFLSGNPDHPNWDFYSGQFDPTYFPDTGYAVLGSASSAIVGYAIVNNYLATFKDEYDPGQNVTIREGDLVVDSNTNTSEPAFKIINTLQGNGVVAPYSFAYLQTEPLFLTRSGVYAITPQDITGERYAQSRSFYLNGKLTKENNLETAIAVIFNDQYVLAINRKLYILDGLQPIRTDKGAPYATRQYAGFYCTNVPAACMWVDDQALWIGTYNGKVCRFDNDVEDLESYNDDGEPIYSCWETPDLDGRLFYKNKTFRYFAIRIMNALRTSCKLYYKKPSEIIDEESGETKQLEWTLIKNDTASGTIFDFELIDFERFSFNTDTSAKVVHSKTRVKKVDKMQFKVENDAKNEPFGLFDLALEYVESGNYKG